MSFEVINSYQAFEMSPTATVRGKAEYKRVMVTMAANIIRGTDEDAAALEMFFG